MPYGQATYLWGGVARIDMVQCPKDVSISFHGPGTLRVLPFSYTSRDISHAQIIENFDQGEQ